MKRSLNRGRVIIPADFLIALNIGEYDDVEVEIKDEEIFIKRYEKLCSICLETSDCFTEFKGKLICDKCMEEIKSI